MNDAEIDEGEVDKKFEPYFTSIGKVSNAFSHLEFSINDAIWELANVERSAGVCMTAQMIGPGPRNRCLLALLKLRGASQTILDEFNKIGKKIEGLGARRNRYAHDPMAFDPLRGQIQRLEATADKHVRYEFIDAEVEKIYELVEDIHKADDAFDELYLRAVAELPSWPRTQFSQSAGIRLQRLDRKTDTTKHLRPPQSSQE
jgi:hypothetical protein